MSIWRNPLSRPGVHSHNLPDGQPHVHERITAGAHPGHRVIAVCGKGGVGKTALSALMARSLAQRPDTGRLLVIDADPALGLALALGIEPNETIASVRDRLLETARGGDGQAEAQIAGQLDYLVFQSLVETDDYAFLAMGRSRDLGCYCSVNELLRDALGLLVREFDTVLVDGEAGLEQINRQVVATVDALVCVSDGSARASRTVETVWDMANENRLVDTDAIYLVLNRQEPGASVAGLRADVHPHLLGSVPADAGLSELDRAEQPLTHLPGSSPALHAAAHLCDHLMAHL